MNAFMCILLSVGLFLGSGFFTGQVSRVSGQAPALIEAAPAGTVRHVTSSATGTGPCDQWANACPLQKALELAQAGDNIWVASGTYKPTSTTNREASFSLKNGVSLYGGFPAAGGDWAQRDWQVNPTVLSGDIGSALLDSYHVVKGIDIIQTATLDGFIIRGGRADGSGSNDVESGRGGGLYLDQSDVTVRNVIFEENYAIGGGGLFSEGGQLLITSVAFSQNTASYNGGGMHTFAGTSATLTEVTFTGNTTLAANPNGNGGGMVNYSSTSRLVNVAFIDNTASHWGGGMSNYSGGTAELTNVSFSGNSAAGDGAGGLDIDHSNATLVNSILWGNTGFPNEIFSVGGTTSVSFSIIQGGCPENVTCDPLSTVSADPLFENAAGGNLRLRTGSPAIDAGKSDAPGLAGVTTDLDGSARFVDYKALGTPVVDMGAYEAQNYLYVDWDAPGPTHDGKSWSTAYTSLQDALAPDLTGSQIWVAAGTYKPTTSINRSASFLLRNEVVLIGGFAGTETSLAQRELGQHTTYLSGEINTANPEDNSYHVVKASGADISAVLDGFTIQDGYANGGSVEEGRGGGIYVENSHLTIRNVIFERNYAMGGGGLFSNGGHQELVNAAFTGNTASMNGGGLHTFGGSHVTLTNVSLGNNYAVTSGSAIGIWDTSQVTLVNTIVWDNPPAIRPSIYRASSGTATISYSLVEGGCPAWASCDHLLADNPLFVDAANGNLRQQLGSPAFNAGTTEAILATGVTSDLDGNPRVLNGRVDQGAYEVLGPYYLWLPYVSR